MALDRKIVVRAALRLLDQVGLEGLTLRLLAQQLHVRAPALYWHFKNKQELLDEMATHVLLRSLAKMLPPKRRDWRYCARFFGQALRRMLLAHRDGAKMLSGTYLTDSSLFGPMESVLRRFVDAGFTLPEAVCALRTIYCYTVGFAIEEQAVFPRPGKRDPRYQPARRAQRIDPQRFPLVSASSGQMLQAGRQFEAGLQLIIRGLRPASSRRPRPAR